MRDKITVFHFNHKQRRLESDRDEAFVKNFCKQLKLTFSSDSNHNIEKSSEGDLRESRMYFFKSAMRRIDGQVLLQGHNLDDVAETFLWRIAMGGGVEALCSPRPIQEYGSFHIVRPFLTYSKDKISHLLNKHSISWVSDSSNESKRYLRNRLRKNTLPNWKKDIQTNTLSGVLRTRDLIEEQFDALEEWTSGALLECSAAGDLDYEKLKKYPNAIKRKVLIKWILQITELKSVRQYHISQIVELLSNGTKFRLGISSGISVRFNGKTINWSENGKSKTQWGECYVPVNARLFLPNGFYLDVETMDMSKEDIENITSGYVDIQRNAYLSPMQVKNGVIVRQRNPGDVFSPLGCKGTKKVKKWMIDQKWEKRRKDNTPIFLNSEKKIIWIPGAPPDHSSRIMNNSSRVIRLTYHKSAP